MRRLRLAHFEFVIKEHDDTTAGPSHREGEAYNVDRIHKQRSYVEVNLSDHNEG